MNLDAELALLAEAVYLPTWEAVEAFIAPHWQLVAPLDVGDTEAMLCRRGALVSALVFRGTEFSRGRLSDIRANFGGFTSWEGPGCLHTGYARHTATVYSAARAAARQVAGAPLVLTGHSLGGCAALIYGARIALDPEGHHVDAIVTFGSPKCFNREAAASVRTPIRRHVVTGDFAERWPVNPWAWHAGAPTWYRAPDPTASSITRHWIETYRRVPALSLSSEFAGQPVISV